MTTTAESNQPNSTTKVLNWLEALLIATLIAGIVLTYINIPVSLLIQIALAGLGILFFIYAFQPIPINAKEGEKFGFQELFAWSIIPKVIFISCAICLVGTLFYTLGTNEAGYVQLLSIGTTSLILALVILAFLKLNGVKHLDNLNFIIIRAVPILVIGAYLLLS